MKRMVILMLLTVAFIFTCNISVSEPAPQISTIDDYIEEEFKIFWPSPVRAHPGVPLDFRFSFYERNNRPVTWTLVDGPQEMTLDSSTGQLDWTPSEQDTGQHALQITASNGLQTLSREVNLRVNRDEFIFISLTGSDTTGDGTIELPFGSIEHAMFSLEDGEGKTIYLRGGTYREHLSWGSIGVTPPLDFKYFSADNPLEVRGYPGETAIWDCELQGGGFYSFRTSYTIYSNLEVRNSTSPGFRLMADYSVVKDVTVGNANYESGRNCSGFTLNSGGYGGVETLVDRCMGIDNYERGIDLSSNWNNSNFLVYTEGFEGYVYILNSYSSGSYCGFKIKHAGTGRLVSHNNYSTNDIVGYAGFSDYSSFRFSIAVNSETGIATALTDPNQFTTRTMLIEHNTIYNARKWAVNVGYVTETQGHIICNNIFYNDRQITGLEGGNRLGGFWIYDASADSYPLSMNHNVFYSPDREGSIIRLGRDEGSQFSFSAWQATGMDVDSRFADPGFTDPADGDFSVSSGSQADFGDSSYAGALAP